MGSWEIKIKRGLDAAYERKDEWEEKAWNSLKTGSKNLYRRARGRKPEKDEKPDAKDLAPPPYEPQACVIPQITNPFDGPFYSPFCRAYAPMLLQNYGIPKEDFLAFVDEINEAFIANPMLQVASEAGAWMGAPWLGVDEVAWAGMGLELGAHVTSAGISYFRTDAAYKRWNKRLFHPVGLEMDIMGTTKMARKVGFPEEKLKMPRSVSLSTASYETTYPPVPLPNTHQPETNAFDPGAYGTFAKQQSCGSCFDNQPSNPCGSQPPQFTYNSSPPDYTHQSGERHSTSTTTLTASDAETPGQADANAPDDPILKRLKCLQGYVMPLAFDVPAQVQASTRLKRMNQKQASKLAKSQRDKFAKRRVERLEKYQEQMRKVEERKVDADTRIEELHDKISRTSSRSETEGLQNELRDVMRDRDRDLERYLYEANKELEASDKSEEKTANQIQWIVIYPREPSPSEQGDS